MNTWELLKCFACAHHFRSCWIFSWNWFSHLSIFIRQHLWKWFSNIVDILMQWICTFDSSSDKYEILFIKHLSTVWLPMATIWIKLALHWAYIGIASISHNHLQYYILTNLFSINHAIGAPFLTIPSNGHSKLWCFILIYIYLPRELFIFISCFNQKSIFKCLDKFTLKR